MGNFIWHRILEEEGRADLYKRTKKISKNIHFRTCRRCGRAYRTYAKFSNICDDCKMYKNQGAVVINETKNIEKKEFHKDTIREEKRRETFRK